ncbi:hypothetical protein GX586_11265 [bacterium]|nr:hypothetical protein [bacterium]
MNAKIIVAGALVALALSCAAQKPVVMPRPHDAAGRQFVLPGAAVDGSPGAALSARHAAKVRNGRVALADRFGRTTTARKPPSPARAASSLRLAPPPNDMFADRTSIAGASGSITGATVEATGEPGEPYLYCGYDVVSNSIWYTWTCPATGRYVFDTAGSDFDTMLGIFTGNAIGFLVLITCNDDVDTLTSMATFHATAGQTYHVYVCGYDTPDVGSVVLCWAPYADVFHFAGGKTDTYSIIWGTMKGSALSYVEDLITSDFEGTNVLGDPLIDVDEDYRDHTLALEDKNNKALFQNVNLPGAMDDFYIQDIVDGLLLVWDWNDEKEESTFILYTMGKNGVETAGSYAAGRGGMNAWIGNGIVYVLYYDEAAGGETVIAFDKKMKELWRVPVEQDAWIDAVFFNGVVFRAYADASKLNFDIFKKGKTYGASSVSFPTTKASILNYLHDYRGGTLFWVYDGAHGPFSVVSRKGTPYFENFTIPEVADFNRLYYSGKGILVANNASDNVAGAKCGKKPKVAGTANVPGFAAFILDMTKSYIFDYAFPDFSVAQYPLSLKQAKWRKVTDAYGMYYFGKGAFVAYSDDGSAITALIFKNGKDIGTHTLTYAR